MEDRDPVKRTLNNTLILNNIFKCMDWETICVCRQVSEMFCKNSLSTWRDLVPPVCLCDSEDDLMGNTKILNGLSLDLDEEEEFRWGGVNKPKHVTIFGTKLDMGWMDNFPFIGTRTDCIHKLHIGSCDIVGFKQLTDIVECKNTPNLTSLRLENLTFLDKNNMEEEKLSNKQMKDVYKPVKSLRCLDVDLIHEQIRIWQFPWDKLFSIYPNLQKIRLVHYSSEELKLVIKVMVDLHKAKQLPQLTTVNVQDGRYENALKFPLPLYEAIRDIDNFLPNLNSLSFAISHSDNRDALPDLLKCLADKLRHLKIIGSFTGKNRSLKVLVLMPTLVSITLKRYHLKNLNFLRNTPNLEKLYIYETRRLLDSHNVIESTKWDEDGTDSVKVECKNLNTFACNQVVFYKHKDISRLQKWMPNLSTLKMHLNNSTFSAICKYFPKLKRLHICQSKVTDYGYTGDRLCGRFKDSNDRNDKKPSEYYETGFSVCSFEIPSPCEPDDSDEDESKASAEKTDDKLSNASDNDNEEDLSVDEETDEEEDEDESDNTSDSDSSLGVSSNKWSNDELWKRRRICIINEAEGRYQRNKNYYMEAYETHPHNAACLLGLEVLVIERCAYEYGKSGLLSTIPFREIFSHLPKLRQVWAEDGAVTESGIQYAFDRGLYFNFDERIKYRPKFIDKGRHT